MVRLAITHDQRMTTGPCGLCSTLLPGSGGPRLCLAESLAPVCQQCGKKHDPALAALLDMARVADRVGRIGTHTLVPPLAALLDLARVAENYTGSLAVRRWARKPETLVAH